MVAQIDEQQIAVVALAVDPAGEAHGLAGIGEAELRRRYGFDRRAWDDPVKPAAKSGGQ